MIELEEVAVATRAPQKPPEFPRYFCTKPPWHMARVVQRLGTYDEVICMRYDNPGCALYYEGGAWVQCTCGQCTLATALRHCERGILMEITPTEALLRIGASQ